MKAIQRLFFIVLATAFIPTFVDATTHRVRQDGLGDFLTIEAAVAASSAGDTVAIGPGTYRPAARISVTVPLTFMSTDGAESTVIDGQDSIMLIRFDTTSMTFTGLTFTRAFGPAVELWNSPGVFRDCTFLRNDAAVRISGGSIAVDACSFRGNGRGVSQVSSGSIIDIQTTTFFETSDYAIYIQNGTLNVTNSVFYLNYGHAIVLSGSAPNAVTGEISGNTFDSNGDAVFVWDGGVSIHNNVIANSTSYGIWFDVQKTTPHDCNLFWNNTLNHIHRGTLAANEVVADPLFCERYSNYSVASGSPALPQNNSCGQIGAFALGCGSPQPAAPEIISVRKDGLGDFDNLQDAVDAAVPFDTIEVDDGTYDEAVVVRRSMSIRSVNGANATVLDGLSSHRILRVDVPVDFAIEGFSFVNGRSERGSAILAHNVKRVRIASCVFVGNDGAVVLGDIKDPTDEAVVEDCHFERNVAVGWGGAIFVDQSRVVIRRCKFIENEATDGGAVLYNQNQKLSVSECLFVGNIGHSGAGAIELRWLVLPGGGPDASIVNNTFHDNQSAPGRATVFSWGDDPYFTDIDRNIFSGERVGFAVAAFAHHSCNVFWNNAGGNLKWGTLSADEVVANPLFCGPASGDFSIATVSPAAPAQNLCALLIGAYPVGCNSVATLIKEFRATAGVDRVDLSWNVVSDDVLLGYQLDRVDASDESSTGLPKSGILPPSSRQFVDDSVQPGKTYSYTLIAVLDDGLVLSVPVTVTTPHLHSSLSQNTPNPFNPSTRIDYSVGETSQVLLTVFDVRGALVRTLVEKMDQPGSKSVTWDGRDDRGVAVSSGIYFYRLQAGRFAATRKMVLVR